MKKETTKTKILKILKNLPENVTISQIIKALEKEFFYDKSFQSREFEGYQPLSNGELEGKYPPSGGSNVNKKQYGCRLEEIKMKFNLTPEFVNWVMNSKTDEAKYFISLYQMQTECADAAGMALLELAYEKAKERLKNEENNKEEKKMKEGGLSNLSSGLETKLLENQKEKKGTGIFVFLKNEMGDFKKGKEVKFGIGDIVWFTNILSSKGYVNGPVIIDMIEIGHNEVEAFYVFRNVLPYGIAYPESLVFSTKDEAYDAVAKEGIKNIEVVNFLRDKN